jgi:hypothetical protein
MTAQSEKSIIWKKPPLTALHAGIVLTPPLACGIVWRCVLCLEAYVEEVLQ